MPYALCERHGGAIAPHGCQHVAERVWHYIYPGHTTFVDLDGFFFCGWLCDQCLGVLNTHGLQEFLSGRSDRESYPSEDTLDPLLELIDLQPMCAACFRELSPASDQPTQPA